ncbi:MAG: DegT/DnrJ/EryC1/StrS family aminotransferase [Candidatus Nanoarchaeia archaeon]|nr:DegT/DnrJ/EryC1/StrS family aminotransferase [Candidatus Jingweiarchaeum tengchongense]
MSKSKRSNPPTLQSSNPLTLQPSNPLTNQPSNPLTLQSSNFVPVNEPLIGEKEIAYVIDCLKTGWVSSAGKYIERFEKEWAAYCGRKYGVAVCNGTVALELALSALELPPGSEVILPSFTIVSCLEAVLRNGLTPVLVDCDPKTYCMDISDVRRNITPKTSAIMAVHIYGHPVNMDELLDIAEQHKLMIIEDAAEAHGAECLVKGTWRKCGSFGQVSCFSFYANKNITTGEGGMVLTDDDEIAERLRSRRNLCFGKEERFRHEDRGWNYRMTNLQAAIGCAQLENLDRFLARKLEMAELYNDGLKDLPLQLPHVEPWARSSIWMYAILLKDEVPFDANEFARRLRSYGVETRPFFRGLHEQPIYRKMGLFKDLTLPVTEKIYRRGLYLPSGQAITNEQIEKVIEAVKKTFERSSGVC